MSYAAIGSLETARDVSAKCGEFTVEMRGLSRAAGAGAGAFPAKATESVSAQKRPLIIRTK